MLDLAFEVDHPNGEPDGYRFSQVQCMYSLLQLAISPSDHEIVFLDSISQLFSCDVDILPEHGTLMTSASFCMTTVK